MTFCGEDNKITKTEGGIKIRIILDTDKKTVTVPWNYTDKLAVMNRTIKEAMGAEAKTLDFKQYLQDC